MEQERGDRFDGSPVHPPSSNIESHLPPTIRRVLIALNQNAQGIAYRVTKHSTLEKKHKHDLLMYHARDVYNVHTY